METRMKNESLVSTLCIIMVHDYVYVSCMPITYCVFAHYLLFVYVYRMLFYQRHTVHWHSRILSQINTKSLILR